jgi:hypothetical protein
LCREKICNGVTTTSSPFKSHSFTIITSQIATLLSADVYKWIEWVVMRHKPLSEVDDPLTREGMKYSAVTSMSFKKYIIQLTPLIEAKIREELAGILFADCTGWMDRRLNTLCCRFCGLYEKWNGQRNNAFMCFN